MNAIDAKAGDVVGTVKLEGDGEQAIIGSDGLIYVNSEDTAEVVVFDPASLTVKKRFPIGVAKTPTGLAYDAKTHRLFIGCRNEPKMVVMDAATGGVLALVSIAAEVLGKLGPRAKRAVPALREALKEEDEMIRDAARHALTRILAKPGRRD